MHAAVMNFGDFDDYDCDDDVDETESLTVNNNIEVV